jgi:hypothetical protein
MERTADRCPLRFSDDFNTSTPSDVRPGPPSLILVSLDLMRANAVFLLLAASAMIVSSCSTPPAFGHVDHVSAADMEAAVSAFRAATRPDAEVGAIEVITHNEIRIYQATERRNYTSMVRVKTKWEVGNVVLQHPAY